MSRSDAVREEARIRDGFRCAICGYDGRDEQFRPWVVGHHLVRLGMGGSDERDTVDNVVCLCSSVEGLGLPPNRRLFLGIDGEGSCHQLVEDGHVKIANWDPETRTFDMLGMDRRPIEHDRLWCHRRVMAEKGEQITERLSVYARATDRARAEDAHELRQVFKAVDPSARSFKEYLAARGIDPRLDRDALLYGRSLSGVPWGEGVTATDYRRLLRDSGETARREFFYVRLPGEIYYRTADEEALRDTMEIGDRLLKIGKTVWGLRADRGRLIDPEGREVEVVHFADSGRTKGGDDED